MKKIISTKKDIATLPPNASVKALLIGLEDYQPKTSGALSQVHYARRDAEAFKGVLQEIYGDRLDAELITDSGATYSNLRYQLQAFIKSLEADDLFIFYYAGHGFHGQGGNRITTWDSNAQNIEGTTLLLREVLLDPLQESECRRALAFVDACAANFAQLVRSRDVITDFNGDELKEYLAMTEYLAMYFSCSPGEKSYPSDVLRHGIWTHFLLQAMRGNAEESLGPGRYLTDQGLKNYLRTAVRRYMTNETGRKGVQTPQAVITASGTFAIREVPETITAMVEAGDLRKIQITPSSEYFEGITEGKIQTLPGFSKRVHFVPDRKSDAASSFVRQLLAEKIQEETQDLYQSIKKSFSLRAREIRHDSVDGTGSIDTDFFRYAIEARQHLQEPAMYQIVRKLELRTSIDSEQLKQIDATFANTFDKVIVKTSRDFTDFSELVDKLEDLAEKLGGNVTDESSRERVTYEAEDGSKIVFSVSTGRIAISAKKAKSVQTLLTTAQGYRFGLTGPSTLLLS